MTDRTGRTTPHRKGRRPHAAAGGRLIAASLSVSAALVLATAMGQVPAKAPVVTPTLAGSAAPVPNVGAQTAPQPTAPVITAAPQTAPPATTSRAS